MSESQQAQPGDRQIETERRIRLRPRISVRALMAAVLTIGAGLAWYLHQVREQQRAVRAITARGGIVEYDYRYDAARERRLRNGKSWCPVWLQKIVGGDDFFHSVVVVGLDVDRSGRRASPTDADLVHIGALRHLRLLYLGGGRITDIGLEHLKDLTELRMLILWDNPISGVRLKHLGGLLKLRHLDLTNTAITDDQLTYLKDLTGLERLDVANNPRLNGSFLQHVADLPKLKELVLRGSGITDSALIALKRARNLQSLMLDRTKITDSGLTYLREIPSLRQVDLSQTAVTDAGMARTTGWLPQASVKLPLRQK
jgi:hypothetical protein